MFYIKTPKGETVAKFGEAEALMISRMVETKFDMERHVLVSTDDCWITLGGLRIAFFEGYYIKEVK